MGCQGERPRQRPTVGRKQGTAKDLREDQCVMRAETERSEKCGEESDLLDLAGRVRTLVFILGTQGGH